ncbi:hypothetical protein NP493_3g06020, partial [Ridgeia piscesae]
GRNVTAEADVCFHVGWLLDLVFQRAIVYLSGRRSIVVCAWTVKHVPADNIWSQYRWVIVFHVGRFGVPNGTACTAPVAKDRWPLSETTVTDATECVISAAILAASETVAPLPSLAGCPRLVPPSAARAREATTSTNQQAARPACRPPGWIKGTGTKFSSSLRLGKVC